MQALSSASAGSVMEAANVAVMSAAVQQKLTPTHFNDGPPSSTPPGERSAWSGFVGHSASSPWDLSKVAPNWLAYQFEVVLLQHL